METLKFKVGDKVRVKSLEWYNGEPQDKYGTIKLGYGWEFIKEMVQYCGKVIKISKIYDGAYKVDDNPYHWQDWMLEDEAVNEIKEMTKEEVFLYLGNTKILCSSTEETVKVQVKLFELGMEWLSGHKGIYEDRYLLFINGVKKLQSTADISIWVKDINRQIEPNEILAIQLKEEKPKFDPQSLRAFDKVLVRNENATVWHARFLDFYANDIYNTTSNEVWIDCVPYNEETQHLHGTAEEAPEFYRI